MTELKAIYPQLILNFDVNGTFILKDTSKKVNEEYMLISTLAENSFAKWDEHQTEPLSFKQYVYTVIHPGDKSDQLLKKQRQKTIATFLDWLKEKNHPEESKILKDFQIIKDKFTNQETKELNFTIFSSFYVMLETLRKMDIPFKVILRSFGSDLKEVASELSNHDKGIKITKWAKIENGNFIFEGSETVKKVDEAFNLFTNSNDNFAVQDDWLTWNKDGERGRSGKPFLYDQSSNNLSLFFDDNITGEELDIIRPIEINGKNASSQSLIGRIIFPVNTKEAMLNDQYFIDLVLNALKQAEVNMLPQAIEVSA